MPDSETLVRNFGHLARLQRFEEIARPLAIEQRIGRLDAQEETIARCQGEPRHIEYRMVRHRQSAQRQQSQHGRIAANRIVSSNVMMMYAGQLCSGRPADIDREINHRDVVLQQVADDAADDAADQHDQRQPVLVQVQRVAQLFDRERRIGVQLAVALLAGGARRSPARSGCRIRPSRRKSV